MFRKIFNKHIPKEERRKYRRLDTIFPVEFQIVNKNQEPISNWHQSFSQDISKGGICITVNNISQDEVQALESKSSILLLQIHSPLSDKSFLAYADVAWIKKVQDSPHSQYVMGLCFTKIDVAQINHLLRFVLIRKVIWHILKLLIVGMIIALGFVLVNNYRLQSRNLALLNQYSVLLEKNLGLSTQRQELMEKEERLAKMLNDSKLEAEILQETLKKEETSKGREIAALEKQLEELKEVEISSALDAAHIEQLSIELDALKKSKEEQVEKLKKAIVNLEENETTLNENLSEVIARDSEIQDSFSMNKEVEDMLVKALKIKLYDWLKNHQIQKTGLIVSFEGDYNLKTTSFLYDHALAIIAYTSFDDYRRARKAIDFFLYQADKSEQGGFYNAYYSNKGEVAEYIAHAGPNLWLGIAVSQYIHKTKDFSYIMLARQIASWIMTLQDKEGGIIGGDKISWYSTEHNLDGYAFFMMMYQLTKEQQYKDTADKILSWLKKYAYGNEGGHINRGKGDATIATDTYAWSIAALGPALLKEMGMNSDEILKFALDNCAVTNKFTDRFGQEVEVSGFDFAKHKNLARGGVISCEWTAQMILSFAIAADYYRQEGEVKKANYYESQTMKYLNELNKMIIASPSAFGQGEWCLPYASQENVETGHGWRTPEGKRTGSVGATAYTIFALSKFNPLKLVSDNEK